MANICGNCKCGKYLGRDKEKVWCDYWNAKFGEFDSCSEYEERVSPHMQQNYYDNCQHLDAILKKFEELDKQLADIKEKLK